MGGIAARDDNESGVLDRGDKGEVPPDVPDETVSRRGEETAIAV